MIWVTFPISYKSYLFVFMFKMVVLMFFNVYIVFFWLDQYFNINWVTYRTNTGMYGMVFLWCTISLIDNRYLWLIYDVPKLL